MVSLSTRNGVGKRIKKKSKATTRKNAIKAKSGKETQNQNILGSFHRSSLIEKQHHRKVREKKEEDESGDVDFFGGLCCGAKC